VISEADGTRGLLTRLAELGAVRLDLEGPADAWPERLLRGKLEQVTGAAATRRAGRTCQLAAIW
jgi:hypothetical protein